MSSNLQFKYSVKHAHNAILWLINKYGGSIDKLSLIKLVFLADIEHLLRYGRPIVGGNYVAMKHGPVPSELYDDLKSVPHLPFESNAVDMVTAHCEADLRELSKSDTIILEEIRTRYPDLQPFTLADITHDYKTWKIVGTDEKPVKIPYEDFFLDAKNSDEREMLDNILEDQEAWEMFK